MKVVDMITHQHYCKWQKFALVLLLLFPALLCGVWSFWVKKDIYYINRAERIAFLVDELTSTPERQQRALDEIAKDETGAFIYLLKHVDDQRPLAHEEALFLNTHPNTFERHFQAGGRRVGETVLRYLCWKTDSCDVQFKFDDAESIKVQKQRVIRYCRENFKDPNLYEN